MSSYYSKQRRNTVGDWLVFLMVIIISPIIVSIPWIITQMQQGDKLASMIFERYVSVFFTFFISGSFALSVGLWGLLLLRNAINTKHNLNIVQQIVSAKAIYPFFGLWFYKRVEGLYHGRKIIISIYPFMFDFSLGEESNIYFSTIRMPIALLEQKTTKASQHCYVNRGNVYYASGGSKRYFRFTERKYNFREMKDIFEEMFRVVQALEAPMAP